MRLDFPDLDRVYRLAWSKRESDGASGRSCARAPETDALADLPAIGRALRVQIILAYTIFSDQSPDVMTSINHEEDRTCQNVECDGNFVHSPAQRPYLHVLTHVGAHLLAFFLLVSISSGPMHGNLLHRRWHPAIPRSFLDHPLTP